MAQWVSVLLTTKRQRVDSRPRQTLVENHSLAEEPIRDSVQCVKKKKFLLLGINITALVNSV